MSILYHCTSISKLESIMEEGLIPQIGERSIKMNEGEKGVYLFPTYEDCETALQQWLGDEFDEEDEVITLEITLPKGFPLEESVEYEKISRQRIGPQYVRFFKSEG
ncbi:hypothetical protein MZM54_03220 [[Brevibacterium] frigoritolerans]|nr:hypothetical protein [Peribacillus frigoritolerans]